MICANCGRPLALDKKKRVLHAEPIEYNGKLSVLFCYDGALNIAKKVD